MSSSSQEEQEASLNQMSAKLELPSFGDLSTEDAEQQAGAVEPDQSLHFATCWQLSASSEGLQYMLTARIMVFAIVVVKKRG